MHVQFTVLDFNGKRRESVATVLHSKYSLKGVAHDVEVLVFRQGVVKIQFWGTLGIF